MRCACLGDDDHVVGIFVTTVYVRGHIHLAKPVVVQTLLWARGRHDMAKR